MGLDMYLTRKSYLWGEYNQETGKFEHGVKVEGLPLLPDGRVKEIQEEAAYWRKANQIHNWFVQNVQDGEDECNPYDVSIEQLQELVDTCKKVLANPELAESLLPTASGFFFGGTDYDEWYVQDLENTVKQLEPLIAFEKELESKQEEGKSRQAYVSYEYRSSW